MTLESPAGETAVRLLRDLGLTPTEAEVYCAALQTGPAQPVSSYKLAQVMGRDPANVAKTLGSLVRRGAMAVAGDKPRLYVPTDPAAFAARVRHRLERRSREAVAVLAGLTGPAAPPDGLTLPLGSAAAVFAKARDLLAGCRRQALVFGAKECLREIGAELEAAAEADGRTVRILSPVAMVTEHAQLAVCDPAGLVEREFLQLVVDDRAWLGAVLDAGPDDGPCGWWADRTPLAPVMAGTLALAWSSGAPPQAAAVSPPAPEFESGVTAPVAPDPVPDPVPDREPAPAPDEDTAGPTFLVRHAKPPAQEKGEP